VFSQLPSSQSTSGAENPPGSTRFDIDENRRDLVIKVEMWFSILYHLT